MKILPKQTNIYKCFIKLNNYKQKFYKSIYSLEPVEFKTLNIYIKLNWANSFIWLFKSFIIFKFYFFISIIVVFYNNKGQIKYLDQILSFFYYYIIK